MNAPEASAVGPATLLGMNRPIVLPALYGLSGLDHLRQKLRAMSCSAKLDPSAPPLLQLNALRTFARA
jgi:hypothetical protein